MIRTEGVTVRFGAVAACDDVDMAIGAGEILGLIGPNGSGKTTLLNAIVGRVPVAAGSVFLGDREITHWAVDRVARAGVVLATQHQMVFPGVSVREALQMARACSPRSASAPDVGSLAEVMGLQHVLEQLSMDLSTGFLRKLGIALALAAGPDVLLLDEPAAGLNEDEARELGDVVRAVNGLGLTVAIVDHDMAFMVPLCDRMVVLQTGRLLCEGKPEVVVRDERVIEHYLGTFGRSDA